ncbi:uncharacterized protein LOC131248303 isoform X2 [Magnolia sinica]|uniref:uncharacterized protein LOC131248303 isoform X2 n=1 Tax=Magnolia sinica TaxID=86752 RepID=UPI0026587407|nr:uncharacterized protein LOC131248303 isoform X2 [Magnolia sinica]
MEVATHQALRCAENLTLPTVQVIVMSANMGCSHCRQRVSHVISKINGLLDYVVDVRNKEVIVRGAIGLKNGPIDLKKRKLGGVHYSNGMKDGKSPHVFQLYLQRFFSNSCFCGVKKK